MLIGKFPEGFEHEENLLFVSLKDFWDPVEFLYLIEMDWFFKKAFMCWTLFAR